MNVYGLNVRSFAMASLTRQAGIARGIRFRMMRTKMSDTPPARELISIHFACNNPDNGDFAGQVCQIALPDGALDLTARAWRITSFRGCPKLRDGMDSFVLAGKRWPVIRRKFWVGNWCWDSFTLTSDKATAFMVWLHGRALFQCEGGWSELCDAWDRPPPLNFPEKWWKA